LNGLVYLQKINVKKIAILIPYFGKFPEWSDLFFQTLKKNSTIDFIFFTNCDTSRYTAPNLFFNQLTFQEYLQLVNTKLSFAFQPTNAYKLCDLRPLFGFIHSDIFKPYDFYGWTDMDILFGDIRSFYTDEMLEKYAVLSTHAIRISGHMALFKNTERNRLMYKKIYQWQEALQKEKFVGIDEHGITHAYLDTIIDKLNQKFKLKIENTISRFLSKVKRRKLFLKEQYTTPFTTIPWIDGSINSGHPDVWYYTNGTITNERDKGRSFLYLHFMNFKSSLWRHDGTPAPWEGKKEICFASAEDMETGIVINSRGIFKR
jgi:hypothetical protein